MSLDGLSGAIDSATQTISSVGKAVNTFVSTGPIGGLSSALSSVSGALSGIGNFLKGLAAGQELPLKNPLFAYASYTYVLGIGILTEQDLNYPDQTYKAGKRVPLICKDANSDPSNRINTVYGQFDFFINNLELNSVIGWEQGCNNTNVMNFSFDVTEPYSMGLFMLALQQGAQANGWDNWRECPFLLIIEFRGNTETGLIKSIPNTTRHIPFSFVDLQMTASERGSVYKCSAMPWNQIALTDDVANTTSDSSAVGSTVQEILQSGENSLQKVLNQRMREMEKQGIVEKADEYLILFPSDPSSNADASQSQDTTEDTGTATETVADAPNAANLFSALGVARSKSNQTLVQDAGNCNVIGIASLGFDEKRKADPAFGKDNAVYDPKTGTFNPGKIKVDGSSTEMRFSQDTSIPAAINQVILQSNFVNTTLDSSKITPEGFREWYRISHKVYTIGETQLNTGLKPRLIVYQVVPYQAHASRHLPPGVKGPGFSNLKDQAVKRYEYIYTGHNVDIIRFEIKFVNGFVYIMGADGLTKTQDKVTANQTGAQEPDKKENIKYMPAGKPISQTPGIVPTILKWTNTLTGNDRRGGGGQEGEAQRAAKLFNQALNNPFDMYNLEMEIIGDPYYIAQSGTGNYTSEQATHNLNTDGSVNYESGEVDISVNFRTPIDINQGTGLYNFGGTSKTALVTQFSGLYCVQTIKSTFANGKFTQVLTGFRRPTQEYEEEPTPNDLPSTTRTVTEAPNTDSDSEEQSGT
jgi:hypothetical protein